MEASGLTQTSLRVFHDATVGMTYGCTLWKERERLFQSGRPSRGILQDEGTGFIPSPQLLQGFQ